MSLSFMGEESIDIISLLTLIIRKIRVAGIPFIINKLKIGHFFTCKVRVMISAELTATFHKALSPLCLLACLHVLESG